MHFVSRWRLGRAPVESGKSLSRHFPEVVSAAKTLPALRLVLDGELVVPSGDSRSFDALLQRIHPAPTRVEHLSRETPALVIVFDLLGNEDGQVLLDRSLRERRSELEAFARRFFHDGDLFRLSPATRNLGDARAWLKRVGSALDGIVAKCVDQPYRAGDRTGMQKIKNYRSADCVVAAFGSIRAGTWSDRFCSASTTTNGYWIMSGLRPP
jgi:ATP-dependent DNA ligase